MNVIPNRKAENFQLGCRLITAAQPSDSELMSPFYPRTKRLQNLRFQRPRRDELRHDSEKFAKLPRLRRLSRQPEIHSAKLPLLT